MDYDDPAVEEQWCSDRRSQVAAYLATEQVTHGQIGDWPAWHFAPYVSIWAIESHSELGWVGWWVICGDLPTDYVSASSIKHPRDAMLAFAHRWRSAAECLALGQSPPGFSLGAPSDGVALAPLLAARAGLLQDFATDTELWDEP
ncbi:DUF4826 family protein [Lysobacter sp. GCM10012299]|uniref:DUF4826 family protein n=1 Tax=Lysobacter sp. GCM10012299 TaxID=3317333 RepID=UPI00360ABE8F